MFNKILIANRGEIALRIINACKELGIHTVSVYSEADRDSLHVKLADECICIGGASSNKSYLHIPAIIAAAEITGADAIHPGYGFLSENAHFAEVCRECGLTFIGPEPEHIQLMGNKSKARETMIQKKIPVVPGSDGPINDEAHLASLAEEIGFPVILKASSGGGGKGMRIVRSREELLPAYSMARTEAAAAFGDDTVYMERYIENPRHIEIQVVADREGNVIHMGERECSVQRNHQKLIEEALSTILTPEKRKEMGNAARRAATAIGYSNLGTVEFLVDGDGSYYFMEMNTRIQVEHTVTEGVTNLDLVKLQIALAAGDRLSIRQQDVKFKGHCMECRINAEDPVSFMPSPGEITAFHPPGGLGVRLDTAAYTGYTVTPYYDSMIGKLITYGQNRDEAIARMRRSLEMFFVEGIKTNIPMHLKILDDPDFQAGNITTHFMERFARK